MSKSGQSSFAERMRRNLDLSKRGISFKSVVAMILFGIIILVFVFFTGYGQSSIGGMGAAARVNNSYIAIADVDSEAQRLEKMYAGLFGGSANMGEQQKRFFSQQALETLINTELIAQYAEKNGIYASDLEVTEVVTKEIPVFQEKGQFKFDRYRSVLEANRMTPADFEGRIRKDRKNQKVRQTLEYGASPMVAETERLRDLEDMQVQYQFVKIERAESVAAAKVTDSEVKEKLGQPEFNKRVEEEFKLNSSKYDKEEEVRAQHILIKAEPGKEAEALAKVQEIKKRTDKEDFGKLAAQYSEDQGSKATKGDLGFFGRGRMVPEFDGAAFTQALNVVGEPVKTQFGYHLIKVLEKRAAKKAEISEHQSAIAKQLIASERLDAELKKLDEASAKNDLSAVEEQLKALGAKWKDSAPVALSAEMIPDLGSTVASQAAFDLSQKNPVSKVVRDGDARYLIRWKQMVRKPLEKGADWSAQARERGQDRLNQWLAAAREQASIERNVAGPGPGDQNPFFGGGF